ATFHCLLARHTRPLCAPRRHTQLASGGTRTLVWSLVSGALPANLPLSSTGTISGTPTNTGTSTFTVKVTDALSQSATKGFSLTITIKIGFCRPCREGTGNVTSRRLQAEPGRQWG